MKYDNYFFLTGRVDGMSPIRTVGQGLMNYTLVIATEYQVIDASGNLVIKENLIPVQLYGKLAEQYRNYFSPDTIVHIEGRIKPIYRETPVYVKKTSENQFIMSPQPIPGPDAEKTKMRDFERMELISTGIKICESTTQPVGEK